MVLKLGARNSFWEVFFIVVCFSIIFKVFHSRKVTGLFLYQKRMHVHSMIQMSAMHYKRDPILNFFTLLLR